MQMCSYLADGIEYTVSCYFDTHWKIISLLTLRKIYMTIPDKLSQVLSLNTILSPLGRPSSASSSVHTDNTPYLFSSSSSCFLLSWSLDCQQKGSTLFSLIRRTSSLLLRRKKRLQSRNCLKFELWAPQGRERTLLKISALTPFLSLQTSISNRHINQQKLYPNAIANIHPCEAELLRRAVCRQRSNHMGWCPCLSHLSSRNYRCS